MKEKKEYNKVFEKRKQRKIKSKKIIERSSELLNKNGKLVIAFPNIMNLSGIKY